MASAHSFTNRAVGALVRFGCASACVVALVGCSPSTFDMDTYVDTLSQALCERTLECCTMDELSWAAGATDVASCQERYRDAFAETIGQDRALVREGSEEYHDDAREACIATFHTATCGELAANGMFQRPSQPCDDILTPTLELGDRCPSPSTCRSRFCPTTTRVCTAVATVGETCTPTTLCDAGECHPILVCGEGYCDEATTTCTARRAVGATCASGIECESLDCDASTSMCVAPTDRFCDGP